MSKSKYTIIPLGKQVLVEPEGEDVRLSETGLYKPDTVEQERKAIGTVIAIGNEVKKQIKVKDKIIYGVYAGDPLNYENKEYKFIDEDSILAILKEK